MDILGSIWVMPRWDENPVRMLDILGRRWVTYRWVEDPVRVQVRLQVRVWVQWRG